MHKFHRNCFFFSGLLVLICMCALPHQVLAEEQIEALKAPFYVGKSVMACGKVAQVTVRSEITYINLDRPYPSQTLALVVWQNELPAYEARFGKVSALENKRVCARGIIEEYRKTLQIIMSNPQFLRLMSP